MDCRALQERPGVTGLELDGLREIPDGSIGLVQSRIRTPAEKICVRQTAVRCQYTIEGLNCLRVTPGLQHLFAVAKGLPAVLRRRRSFVYPDPQQYYQQRRAQPFVHDPALGPREILRRDRHHGFWLGSWNGSAGRSCLWHTHIIAIWLWKNHGSRVSGQAPPARH